MILYIVRHGDAETPAPSDDARELSNKGRRVTAAMAKLLKDAGFDPPEFILSSPLSRANQTARIMQEEFAPKASFETNEGLRPGTSLERLMSIIASKKDECEALMIVSHDPMISALASAILTGKDEIVIEMKKSSVVMLEISRFDVSRMRGALRAYLPPEII